MSYLYFSLYIAFLSISLALSTGYDLGIDWRIVIMYCYNYISNTNNNSDKEDYGIASSHQVHFTKWYQTEQEKKIHISRKAFTRYFSFFDYFCWQWDCPLPYSKIIAYNVSGVRLVDIAVVCVKGKKGGREREEKEVEVLEFYIPSFIYIFPIFIKNL